MFNIARPSRFLCLIKIYKHGATVIGYAKHLNFKFNTAPYAPPPKFKNQAQHPCDLYAPLALSLAHKPAD